MKTKVKNGYHNNIMHALCPYFAMFPPKFARDAILKYSKPNDLVVDPFSGRGTTLLEARLLGRNAIANDINPVAVAITKAKSVRLDLNRCLNKIKSLKYKFNQADLKVLRNEASELPIFFKYAYNPDVLLQILWLKKVFKKVLSPEHIFIKALCLGHLHGETQKTKLVYFSNNLPHTYCPKPDYSIAFWKKRKMKAPRVNVFDILEDRCKFRLKNSNRAETKLQGKVILGDVRDLPNKFSKITNKKASLIVTSPPYIRITSYEEDQWLRLWFLGHQPFPARGLVTKDDRIVSKEKYINFLADSWKSIRKIMKKNGIMVCRIGQSSRDNFSLKYFMKESIRESESGFKILSIRFSAFKKTRQSIMFGSKNVTDSGEYDFVLKAI